MRLSDYELCILIGGQRVDEQLDKGSETTWIAVPRGQEFELFVRNDSCQRVLAVPTIDGLSVMDGKPGSWVSGGYVVEPASQMIIPGWRLDNDNVARFEFGTIAQGYASQMGYSPRNVGVIACAFFAEAKMPAQIAPPHRHTSSAPFDNGAYDNGGSFDNGGTTIQTSSVKKNVQATTDDIAVGFGSRASHKTIVVSFKRASETPDAVLEIRYDTVRGLKNRGIGCQPPKAWSDNK